MGIHLSRQIKPNYNLSHFSTWNIERFSTAVETFETESTSFGWAINKEIYQKSLNLNDELTNKTWKIWDKQDINKLNALEIFAGICLLLQATFEEKVIAMGSLFDFHDDKIIGMKSFTVGIPLIIQSICKITGEKIPEDETIQLIAKNSFKSADCVTHFQRRIPIETKLVEWCYAAGEPFYIFSQFNTTNFLQAMTIREDIFLKWVNKSPYFKLSLKTDIEKEHRKFGGVIVISAKSFINNDGSYKRNSVFTFDDSIRLSKLIYVNPKKRLQNNNDNDSNNNINNQNYTRRESRWKLHSVESVFKTLKESLATAIKNWREYRVDSTTRVGGFFTIRDVFDNKSRFDAIDSDSSGEIELSEFVSMFPDVFGGGIHATRIFRSMDKDRSGKINFYELISKLYPLAAKKDKLLVSLWTQENYISRPKILQLKSLFKAINNFYSDICPTDDVVPCEPMFAILARTKEFFPFTVYVKTKTINGGQRFITIEKLIRVLFKHDHKHRISQILRWITPAKLTLKQWNDLKLLFGTFDSDGNGTIDEDEFLHACQQFNLSSELTEGAFARYDLDHSGTITFQDFHQFFCDVWNNDNEQEANNPNESNNQPNSATSSEN